MKGTLIKATILASTLTLLSACSSMSTLKTENLKEKQVPTWYLEHADIGNESSKWYKPWDKQGMYYAVAESVSPDMEMALKKATLKAKAKIADRVNGEMNNRTTMTYTETGNPDAPTGRAQAQDVIVNLISETVLRTYGVDKKMVVYNPELRNYRAFVLMKISQNDVKAIVAKFDAEKAAKISNRVAGKTIDETAKEVLEQARQ
jgi:hypothetical protein